jgi:oligopeptide transport system substrate-binding protein
MKKILLLIVSIMVAGTMLLAACNQSTTTNTTSTQTTSTKTTSTQTTPTKTTSTKTTLPVTGGGTLNLYGTNPYTLDPAVSSDANSSNYIQQIFSGLVKLDDNLEPAGDIAVDWQMSADYKTYTFNLRQDVVFQDGKKLTAADVKYSWERACSPATGSAVAATYLGDIAGTADVLSGKTKEITGVEAVNDYTLRVTIDAPKSYFLYKLTYPCSMVVDKNNVTSGTWWRTPNGTGPFKLKEWQDNSLLVLERNTRYYGEKTGVEMVEFQMLSGLPMSMYETGSLDVTDVSSTYIDRVTDPAQPFAQELNITPELSFYWVGFNTNEPPFDDVNVRKAFTQAIDKDKIITLILRDMVDRADGILPPGIPGYNESLTGLGFNAEQARASLKASRYGDASNLPAITLTTSGYGNRISPVLEAMVAQWQENLGVEVTVRQLDPNFFTYNLKAEKDQMFDMGWVADYPHPQDFLDVLFHTGAQNNFAEYSNPAVDSLLDAAAIEPDTEKSFEMYRQAEQMLVDDAAMLPIYFGKNYILVKPYVKNYAVNAMGFVQLSKVVLEGK